MYTLDTTPMLLLFCKILWWKWFAPNIVSFILFFLFFSFLWEGLSKDELNVENKSTLCLFFQEYNLTLCIFKLSIFTTTISSHFVYRSDFLFSLRLGVFGSNFCWKCNPMVGIGYPHWPNEFSLHLLKMLSYLIE